MNAFIDLYIYAFLTDEMPQDALSSINLMRCHLSYFCHNRPPYKETYPQNAFYSVTKNTIKHPFLSAALNGRSSNVYVIFGLSVL